MEPKQIIRMAVDIGMTVLLLLLMAFMLTGQKAHEWLGAAELVLFIAHHVLNARWLKILGTVNTHRSAFCKPCWRCSFF